MDQQIWKHLNWSSQQRTTTPSLCIRQRSFQHKTTSARKESHAQRERETREIKLLDVGGERGGCERL